MTLRGIATDLSTNLAGGNWRLALPGMATGDYWRTGYGESIVSSNLDVWTGQVNGNAMTAPSSGQRPTPDGNGWAFLTANTTTVVGAAVLAAQLSGTAAYTVIVHSSGTTAGVGTFWCAADSGDTSKLHALQHTSGTDIRYQRRNATSANLVGTGTLGATAHSIAAVHGGTNSEVYFDGASIAGPTALARDPADLDVVALGSMQDSSPSNYLTGTIHEAIICMAALDAATIATVSANLAAEYA